MITPFAEVLSNICLPNSNTTLESPKTLDEVPIKSVLTTPQFPVMSDNHDTHGDHHDHHNPGFIRKYIFSTDLQAWNAGPAVAPFIDRQRNAGSQTETLVYRAAMPISESPRIYARIEAVLR